MTIKKELKNIIINRRRFIQTGATAMAGLILAACSSESPAEEATPTEAAAAQARPTNTSAPPSATPTATDTSLPEAAAPPTGTPAPTSTNTPLLEPTPYCDDHNKTLAQTAGPFYTPNTPERSSFLEEGITGIKLVVTGQVLTPNCQPIAGAVLDFWHADDNGQYDNAGYRLRGHQFTDANGNYYLETVMPGLYPGRTRHIHVIVQGPETAPLTTQLYFPNEPGNQTDGIFHPALVMDVNDAPDGKAATFNFVLA